MRSWNTNSRSEVEEFVRELWFCRGRDSLCLSPPSHPQYHCLSLSPYHPSLALVATTIFWLVSSYFPSSHPPPPTQPLTHAHTTVLSEIVNLMYRQVQWSFLCPFPLPFSNIRHAWPHFPSWNTLLTLLWESTPLIFFAPHQPLLPSSFGRPPLLCSVSECWDPPGLCPGTLVLHGFSLAISSSPMALNTGNADDSQNFISRIDLCHELQACIPSSPLVWHLKHGMSQTVLLIPLYLPSVFPILVPSYSSPKPNSHLCFLPLSYPHLQSFSKSYFLYLQDMSQFYPLIFISTTTTLGQATTISFPDD